MSLSSAYDLYGFDLLLNSVQTTGTFENDTEIVIIFTHWFLTKIAGFRSIGIGDGRTVKGEDIGSELLPEGWNASHENYTIRYLANKDLCILYGYYSGTMFVVKLLNVETEKNANIGFYPSTFEDFQQGSIYDIAPTAYALINRFQTELLNPVLTAVSKAITTQTDPPPKQEDNVIRRLPPRPPGAPPRQVLIYSQRENGLGQLFLLDRNGGPPRRIAPGDPEFDIFEHF